MGNIVTFILAVLVIGYGGYTLYKSFRKSADGKSACACSSMNCSSCPSRSKVHEFHQL